MKRSTRQVLVQYIAATIILCHSTGPYRPHPSVPVSKEKKKTIIGTSPILLLMERT